MISPEQARAVRRLLLFAAALAATLVAHAIAAGGVRLAPVAPLLWGSLASLTVFTGARGGPGWRRHGAGGILVRLVALQAALHLAMGAAPWAFGLEIHHRPALLAPVALVAHGVAALVLTVLLVGAEWMLSILQRVVEAVRAALRPERGARHRPAIAITLSRAPVPAWRRPDRARGPPSVIA